MLWAANPFATPRVAFVFALIFFLDQKCAANKCCISVGGRSARIAHFLSSPERNQAEINCDASFSGPEHFCPSEILLG